MSVILCPCTKVTNQNTPVDIFEKLRKLCSRRTLLYLLMAFAFVVQLVSTDGQTGVPRAEIGNRESAGHAYLVKSGIGRPRISGKK